MSLSRFFLYVEAAQRGLIDGRKAEVCDLVASIQSALGGKGLQTYLDKLTVGDDG